MSIPLHDGPWARITGTVLALFGLALAGGGAYLLTLHGSPYYLLSGLTLLACGVLLALHQRLSLWLYAVLLLLSTSWALTEVGLDFWQLLPRLDLLFGFGLLLLLPAVRRPLRNQPQFRSGTLPLCGALLITLAVAALAWPRTPGDIEQQAANLWAPPKPLGLGNLESPVRPQTQPLPPTPDGDWPSYGGTAFGQRYSALQQITPDNVAQLETAWHYHTGDLPTDQDPLEITNEVTPIKIGNTLYLCTPHSVAIALDASTGKEKWRFDPQLQSADGSFRHWAHMTCRGVSYYDAQAYLALDPEAPTPQAAAASSCPRRIFLPTADARLIALNATPNTPNLSLIHI